MVDSSSFTTTAGISRGYRRTAIDPGGDQARSGFQPLHQQYRYFWSLYNNTIFEDALKWLAYKGHYRLYKNTRSVFNPFGRLVDLYAGFVYGGVLTDDGLSLPNGQPCAVPLDPNTPEELRLAIAQYWRWGNFQSQKSVLVRYGAALGDAFIEVLESPDREKVWMQPWWPGFVADLELSPQGDVQRYALEYVVSPPDADFGRGNLRRLASAERPFRYRKEVDKEGIRTYKDDKPFGYDGGPSEWAHDLGFCPAAWIKHRDYGADHGANAWEASQAKLEELNGIMSRIDDQIHKVVGGPVIFWTDSKISSLAKKTPAQAASPDSDEVRHPEGGRDEIMVLKGPANGRREMLVGELNIADALQAAGKLIEEIEADHPELTMWQELRQMSQVTGPGARRLIGDVYPRITEPAANYDRALIACHGMGIAIAGQRVNDGDWVKNTRQQQLFGEFDLTSYDRGELDHNIMPRQLIEDTEDERLARAKMKMELGYDQETIMMDLGEDEDRIAKMRVRREQAEQAALERQMAIFNSGATGGAFGGTAFDGPPVDEEE